MDLSRARALGLRAGTAVADGACRPMRLLRGVRVWGYRGTHLAYGATREEAGWFQRQRRLSEPSLIRLRSCYALSGTDLAYAATCLRSCYALSRTDLAYAATCSSDVRYSVSPLLSAYDRAARCPVKPVQLVRCLYFQCFFRMMPFMDDAVLGCYRDVPK
eukprot:3940481-Rhodomonas_salina.14